MSVLRWTERLLVLGVCILVHKPIETQVILVIFLDVIQCSLDTRGVETRLFPGILVVPFTLGVLFHSNIDSGSLSNCSNVLCLSRAFVSATSIVIHFAWIHMIPVIFSKYEKVIRICSLGLFLGDITNPSFGGLTAVLAAYAFLLGESSRFPNHVASVGEKCCVISAFVLFAWDSVMRTQHEIDNTLSSLPDCVDGCVRVALIGSLLVNCLSYSSDWFVVLLVIYLVGPIQLWASMFVKEVPLIWLFKYIFSSWVHIALLLYWGFLLGLALYGLSFHSQRLRISPHPHRGERLFFRKAFHFLAVALFWPALKMLPSLDFLKLSLAIATAILVVVEIARARRVPLAIRTVDEFMDGFRDQRDPGNFIKTHIYLLIGCAIPIWLAEDPSQPEVLSGILSIGIGDAVASIFGVAHGKTKWPGSRKSLEGSAASFTAQILMLAFVEGSGGSQFRCAAIALAVGTVLEAVTVEIDNLIVPCFVFSCWRTLRNI
eukprot:m.110242 g.110242  ORF g.110242 m.110242 type:complete len:488 (+) comp14031_c0_seq2:83-1546(+)